MQEVCITAPRSCSSCGKSVNAETLAKGGKRGTRAVCKPCWAAYMRSWASKNKQKVSETNARYRAAREEKVPGYHKNYMLQLYYGITLVQYEEMLLAQGGVCAICGEVEKQRHNRTGKLRRLAVDHDHVTGEVRGLLCAPCNQAIGLVDEDPKRLSAMIDYLQRNT